jgi:hypothetical protein
LEDSLPELAEQIGCGSASKATPVHSAGIADGEVSFVTTYTEDSLIETRTITLCESVRRSPSTDMKRHSWGLDHAVISAVPFSILYVVSRITAIAYPVYGVTVSPCTFPKEIQNDQ